MTTAELLTKTAKHVLSLQEQVNKLTEQCQRETGKLQEQVAALERGLETRRDVAASTLRKVQAIEENLLEDSRRYHGDSQIVGWLNDLKDRITQLEKNQAPVEVMRPGGGIVFHPDTYDQIFEKIYQEVRRVASGELVGPGAADAAMRVMKLLPHPYKRG